MSSNTPKRGIRPTQAAEKLGISLPTLWRLARTNKYFPRPKKLSERVTIWDEAELDAFLTAPKFEKAEKVAA